MKTLYSEKTILAIAKKARAASRILVGASRSDISKVLLSMADALVKESELLKKENDKDLVLGVKNGLSGAMLDRLKLSDKTIATMVTGLKTVAKLPAPIGTLFDERTPNNGLSISRMIVPIGVVGIIYESRPNVTVDAAAICLKSQNAVILRGGSEAFHSNVALAKLFSKCMKQHGLPSESVQLIPTTDRAAIDTLLTLSDDIDLIIPRGGEGLIRAVVEKSRIPVIKHYKGVCHVYVSSKADIKKAIAIAVNAKISRPGVCNAMETILLDSKLTRSNKKAIIDALLENNVILYGDTQCQQLSPAIKKATKADWYAEYLDLRCAIRIVDDIAQAIDHINTYGSHHTDAIVSENKTEQTAFLSTVDSASVMINASTRFADGGEYGMGCEIGISTDKLHARGPMGISELTTYKWIVKGNGQIRI